jgi:NAD(P)-dependent dehydrogenase (short-subunit alcohol dehydrogenase family)
MDRIALVTGASSGIGEATVKRLMADGYTVFAAARRLDRMAPLAAAGARLLALDLTDDASIVAAMERIRSEAGRIDVLVNNAGYGALGALEAASEEEIRRQLEVNLFGLIAVTKAILPGMRQRRSGVIVNVSSMGGRIAFPFSTLYHATKYAVEGLTESLQYELAPFGIRTRIIEPGGYKTEFAGRSLSTFGAGDLADYRQAWDRYIAKISQWDFSENIREVADIVYQAATDGSDRLRYPVGQDAVQLLQLRQQMDDPAFQKTIAEQTGIA